MHFDSFQPQGTFLATNFDFEILFYHVTKAKFKSQIQIQKKETSPLPGYDLECVVKQ